MKTENIERCIRGNETWSPFADLAAPVCESARAELAALKKLASFAESLEAACSGCLGKSVAHTCGREPDADRQMTASLTERLARCEAALLAWDAYDAAIRRRGATGDCDDTIDARGAIAEGIDLDRLYMDAVRLMTPALADAPNGESGSRDG